MKKEAKYPCKDIYTKMYDKLLGGEWWAEWYFYPERKWRFDYALPELKIAIEIDGGVFTGGRHSGGIGQKKDMEKMNAAVLTGWRVLHYTPDEKFISNTIEQIKELINFVENGRNL